MTTHFESGSASRRRWLASLCASGVAVLWRPCSARAQTKSTKKSTAAEPKLEDLPPETLEVLAGIRKLAQRAGLKELSTTITPPFVAVGDAPESFRKEALRICRDLSRVYASFFKGRGFEVAVPETTSLVVMTLGSIESFQKYAAAQEGIKVAPGGLLAGFYSVGKNMLVMFDFRADRKNLGANSERANTFSLVHEEMHQLCYNTGLLDRAREIPVAVSEGLGTFAEVWDPFRRGVALGAINKQRLNVLRPLNGGMPEWIPMERLFSTDELFYKEETEQEAYAEAWLFTHLMLRDHRNAEKFRGYLDLLHSPRVMPNRIEDATLHFGDLRKLDIELKRYRDRLALKR